MNQERIVKARKARDVNIQARKLELAKIVKQVDACIVRQNVTVTQACRDKNISTERYYRFKRSS